MVSFSDLENMTYEKVLGGAIRELRLNARMTRDACGEAVTRAHLAKIELGNSPVQLKTLRAICELLKVSPAQLLLLVESRLAGSPVREMGMDNIRAIEAIPLNELPPDAITAGVRGLKADEKRQRIGVLRAQGMKKTQIARKLGIAVRTVDRYWIDGEGDVKIADN